MFMKIYASILNAPEGKVQETIDKLSEHVDGIHYDVMDGKFVPPTTFTAEDFSKLNIPVANEVHLMVQHPDKNWVKDFADAGAEHITIHFESEQESVKSTLEMIKDLGLLAGLSIKPKTAVSDVPDEIWVMLDSVLIMSVEPGWGGQKFIPESLDKVRELRAKYPDLDIGIDGGINAETGKLALEAGCTTLGVGSYLVKSEDYAAAVAALRAGA